MPNPHWAKNPERQRSVPFKAISLITQGRCVAPLNPARPTGYFQPLARHSAQLKDSAEVWPVDRQADQSYSFKMKTVNLIVAADEPALFFSSITAGEKYLEAVDVENGVYTAAFGPNGESYQLKTEGNRVLITLADKEGFKTAELRSLLLKFMEAIGEAYSQKDSLPDLLRKCESHLTA